MRQFSISPGEMFAGLLRHRDLIAAMIERDIVGRYRGSFIGLAWSFFNPLLMLLIYTFVFSVIFNARWGLGPNESRTDFAIILFVGIIVHGIFAECLNRAPTLILDHSSYVKKVVFPLEVLPWVTMGSALFHALVSVAVLLLAQGFFRHVLPWTAALFPLVLVPLAFAAMGFSWFLAATGVYVRDLAPVTAVFTTILMFMSPVFYPVSSLPPSIREWMWLNPLAVIIEEGRNTLVFGRPPEATRLAISLAAGLACAWLGFAWFQKSRRGFADVV